MNESAHPVPGTPGSPADEPIPTDLGASTHVTPLQLDLLRIVWSHRECSVDTVRDELAARHQLARSTVHTLLHRLARRGVLTLERRGRQQVFRPAVSEFDVRRAMVNNMVQSLYRGRTSDMLAHLLEEPGLGAEELALLSGQLAEAEQRSQRLAG